MSNKKLTQLTEKLTSLDPNDLLYVSSGGVSKSIKASTVEAPLKTYAETKASEAQAAAISAANSTAQSLVNAEAARATSAESGLQTQITQEVSSRIAADNGLQSQINSVSATLVPVGVISMYAGTTAPSGYLLCDGSAVSRSTYSALFEVIGTSFGAGDETTTFNLPNPDSNANIRLIIKI